MISVIVPVYNTAQYLERVIEALLAQDFPRDEFELIFVDNGSEDNSRAILERYPQIRVFVETERGSYAARNRGIREARGDILAFTDSDCYPVAGWLSEIEKGFQSSPAQVLLGPRIPPVENNWLRLLSDYENKKAELVCLSNDAELYFGHTNNMAVRRSAMDRCGPFTQRARGSDTIFVRRIVGELSCDAVTYCPGMCVQHAELESVSVYYGKVATYGRSRKAYRHITKVRPLSQKERFNVFREATRKHGIIDKVQLFTLLVGGAIAWWLGGFLTAKSNA